MIKIRICLDEYACAQVISYIIKSENTCFNANDSVANEAVGQRGKKHQQIRAYKISDTILFTKFKIHNIQIPA